MVHRLAAALSPPCPHCDRSQRLPLGTMANWTLPLLIVSRQLRVFAFDARVARCSLLRSMHYRLPCCVASHRSSAVSRPRCRAKTDAAHRLAPTQQSVPRLPLDDRRCQTGSSRQQCQTNSPLHRERADHNVGSRSTSRSTSWRRAAWAIGQRLDAKICQSCDAATFGDAASHLDWHEMLRRRFVSSSAAQLLAHSTKTSASSSTTTAASERTKHTQARACRRLRLRSCT